MKTNGTSDKAREILARRASEARMGRTMDRARRDQMVAGARRALLRQDKGRSKQTTRRPSR